MTSNAQWKGWVAMPSHAMSINPPACVATMRTLASNWIWLHEQSAQVRIKMVGFGSVGTLQGLTGRADVTDTWQELATIPFSTRLRSDGRPFEYRVRLAGCVSSTGPTVGFRVGIGGTQAAAGQAAELGTGTDSAEVTGITATAFAWLSLSRTVLVMSSQDSPGALSVGAAEPGGEYAGADVPQAWLAIWSKIDTASAPVPVVGGVVVEEFIGG